jgi:DNA-binding Lrp family transcriptional regulator
MKTKLSPLDKKIINFLSFRIPQGLEPFNAIAARLGIKPEQVFKKIARYKKTGILRKFGASLNHHNIGFKFNAMGVWKVPADRINAVAKIAVLYPQISHCYQRRSYPVWPYNFYTMIHARKKSDCLKIAKEISSKTKIKEYRLLFSQKEYKKQGRVYFNDK